MQKQSSIRFACIGDLVADYYYYGNVLTNVDGGRSKFNDLANLGKLGNECVTFSTCSNSQIGEMLCIGLQRCNVNTSYVQKLNVPSRIYNLLAKGNGEYLCTKICPKCGRTTWYEESFTKYDKVHDLIRDNDVFIFDSIKPEDLENMSQLISNDKVLDLGSTSYLSKISFEKLKSILQNGYEIVQINKKVAQYLIKCFKLNELGQLKKVIRCKLLIITLGNAGAYFFTATNNYKKILDFPSNEVDTLGAGDAFFSTFIDGYYKNNKEVNQDFIDFYFEQATRITSKVVQSFGGRGHLYSKIKIKEKSNTCVCQDFEIQNGR